MFENKAPHHPSFPDIHLNKGLAPTEIPMSTKITILDRFYVRSGDVLIKIGSALKSRSAITQKNLGPAINEIY